MKTKIISKMRSKNCRRRRESIFLSSLFFYTIVREREKKRERGREEGKYRLSLDLFSLLADVFHSRPIDEFAFVWDEMR